MKHITFATNYSQQALCCPHCESPFMHQGRVRVWQRREDATAGTYAEVNGKDSELSHGNLPVGNPSRRRQGLTIDLECEGCGRYAMLAVTQHKGNTFIGWE